VREKGGLEGADDWLSVVGGGHWSTPLTTDNGSLVAMQRSFPRSIDSRHITA
jgi:hypothetical protein